MPNPPQFTRYQKEDVLSLTHLRKYETKLGEVILCGGPEDLETAISQTPARYILFGIPEDIGVRANLGQGGAASAWKPFLDSFLNIQSNEYLSGESVFIAGHFDFTGFRKLINVNAASDEEKMMAYRSFVNTIDEEVEDLVKMVTYYGKIPIIIGGGHNNAYPAIKGAAKGLFQAGALPLAQINCINLDAHTDYRPSEGRHSGNAFRYADEDGYLLKYFVLGIHENYLQQIIWMDMANSPFIQYITYEDIFIHEKKNFNQAVAHATGFTGDNFTGIELDLDSIENALSSAMTPCGISPLQARQYMNFVATDSKIAYVHICEGAAGLDSGQTSSTTGKLISYLVSDFVKSHLETKK